jgi:hypothetical protein
MTKLRAATDAEDPTTVWINVVSAVRRESTSPVRVTSKNVVEHCLADVRDHALAEPCHEVEADCACQSEGAREADQGEKILVDPGGELLAEAVLDELSHGRRDQEARGRRTDQRHDGDGDDEAIGAQERHQLPQGLERTGFGAACGHILQLFCEFFAGLRHVCPFESICPLPI